MFVFLRRVYYSILLLGCLLPSLSFAQHNRSGVLHLVGWPASVLEDAEEGGADPESVERLYGMDLLPFIDTLTLGYQYAVLEEQPFMSLALEWKPGAFGLYDGEKVPYEALPDDVRMVAVALHADIYAGDERVTDVIIRVDSMALGPYPDLYTFEADDLSWAMLFPDLSESAARSYFERGLVLRDPEVLHVAFAAYGEADAVARGGEASGTGERQRRASRAAVYTVDTVVDAGIYIHVPLRAKAGRGAPARRAPRREMGGRRDTASRETGHGRRDREKRSSDEKDQEDEEDENKLLPAALTAAAAVGIIAYAGGTVGYYGNVRHAPVGLSAGFVRAKGGMLLQVGANEALLTSGDGPRKLIGRLTGFYGTFGGPVQPALGAGVLAVEEGSRLDLRPSLAVGLAGVFGPVLVLGAYDVVNDGFELGLALNFRRKALRSK